MSHALIVMMGESGQSVRVLQYKLRVGTAVVEAYGPTGLRASPGRVSARLFIKTFRCHALAGVWAAKSPAGQPGRHERDALFAKICTG